MQAILSIGFGVEAKSQTDENDRIKEKAKLFVHTPWWLDIVTLIPFSRTALKYIPRAFKSRFQPLEDTARAIVERRRKDKIERKVTFMTYKIIGLLAPYFYRYWQHTNRLLS